MKHAILQLDRERRWQIDVPAFERACDGFEQVGLEEFADNPLSSVEALVPALQSRKLNRKVSRIMRVWLWAGLTSEDPELTLEKASAFFGPGELLKNWLTVMPVLVDNVVGPRDPAVTEASDEPERTGGPLAVMTSA